VGSLEDKIAITRRFQEQVLPRIERGEVRPVIDSVWSLDDVGPPTSAWKELSTGKIILRP
jgi:NADPH:quinone reductase-like Zn-dependent oxidoreductase